MATIQRVRKRRGVQRSMGHKVPWKTGMLICHLVPRLRDNTSACRKNQRKRDDNKNKICAFQGGMGRGAGRKIVQNAIFRGKRHDNKILKVKILLSRNFVVMAQAPKEAVLSGGRTVPTKTLFKENAPFISFILMGPFARTLFSRTLLP